MTTPASLELKECRDAFEAWLPTTQGWKTCKLRGKPFSVRQTVDGSYADFRVNDRWIAYRSAWNTRAQASSPSRNRPSAAPGGVECHTCGCIFIGDESHTECGVCVAKEQASAPDGVEAVVSLINTCVGWVSAVACNGSLAGSAQDDIKREITNLFTRSNAKAGEVNVETIREVISDLREWGEAGSPKLLTRALWLESAIPDATHDKTKA